MVTQNEVLAYARECQRQRPQITEEELRAFLEAKFLDGADPLAKAAAGGLAVGAIRNPLDWLKGLLLILKGVERLCSDKELEGIKDIIDGVLVIVCRNAPAGV
jgi:hypothetical protein